MGEITKVAKKHDLEPGTSFCVEAGGYKIALFNVEGNLLRNWRHVHSQRGIVDSVHLQARAPHAQAGAIVGKHVPTGMHDQSTRFRERFVSQHR